MNLYKSLRKKLLEHNDSSVDAKIKEIMFNPYDEDAFIKALQLKYGNIIPLYHATSIENSQIIDKEGFKLVNGKNYISYAQEPIMYAQVGKSDYTSTDRPVVYRIDAPIQWVAEFAYIDMDSVGASEEDLLKYRFTEEDINNMPSDTSDALIYFIGNNMSLEGTELLLANRNNPDDVNIFKGLKITKLN